MNGFHAAWASSWQQTVAVKPVVSSTSHPSNAAVPLNPIDEPVRQSEQAGGEREKETGNKTVGKNSTSAAVDWDPKPTTKTVRQRRGAGKK